MTVRFPNGQAVQYNSAHYLLRTESGWVLKTSETGTFVAFIQLSAGAIVEFSAPCRVYDAVQEGKLRQLEACVDALTKEIRLLKRKLTK